MAELMELHYSILIQWSDEDQIYVVSLPEFGPYAHMHGKTYEEALQNAQEVLELLVEAYEEQGKPLPQPKLFNISKLQNAEKSRNAAECIPTKEKIL